MLFLKKAILAKIESAYGTDPTPTGAANAILARNMSITPLEAEMSEREVVLPYFGSKGAVPGSAKVMLEFEVEMAGSGTAGTAPAWGPLIRACGFAETTNVSTSVEYDPVSASFESVTIYFQMDGVQHKVTGCRGNVSLEASNEGIPVFKFAFTGIYNAPTDTALATLTLTAWKTPLPMNKVNTTFTLQSYSAILASLSIDVGNVVNHKAYVNSSELVRITGRKVSGSAQMEAVLVATKDWFGIARAGTTGALQMVHGTTSGNKVQIDAPVVQISNPRYEDADGVAMLAADLIFQSDSAGNDELKITSL